MREEICDCGASGGVLCGIREGCIIGSSRQAGGNGLALE